MRVPGKTTAPAAMTEFFPNYRAVHHDGSHSDQHIVFYRAAVYNCVVRDGNIAADDSLCFFKGAMYDGAILNIGVVADCYRVHISAYYSIEPDCAIVPHRYLAHNDGIIGQETILSEARLVPSYAFNYCHI